MRAELSNVLTAYLNGWITIPECVQQFASFEFDRQEVDEETKRAYGRLLLLATEVTEALRPEKEFAEEAARIVQESGGAIVFVPPSSFPNIRVGMSSADTTSLAPDLSWL